MFTRSPSVDLLAIRHLVNERDVWCLLLIVTAIKFLTLSVKSAKATSWRVLPEWDRVDCGLRSKSNHERSPKILESRKACLSASALEAFQAAKIASATTTTMTIVSTESAAGEAIEATEDAEDPRDRRALVAAVVVQLGRQVTLERQALPVTLRQSPDQRVRAGRQVDQQDRRATPDQQGQQARLDRQVQRV